MIQLTTPTTITSLRYFTEGEIRCKCGCEKAVLNPEFGRLLDNMREELGMSMFISSWYRCPSHPVEKKKQAPGSHSTGAAADILVPNGLIAFQIMRKALEKGVTRIGYNLSGPAKRRFIHIDIADKILNEDGTRAYPQFVNYTTWGY